MVTALRRAFPDLMNSLNQAIRHAVHIGVIPQASSL
jgi:hypothetical protein